MDSSTQSAVSTYPAGVFPSVPFVNQIRAASSTRYTHHLSIEGLCIDLTVTHDPVCGDWAGTMQVAGVEFPFQIRDAQAERAAERLVDAAIESYNEAHGSDLAVAHPRFQLIAGIGHDMMPMVYPRAAIEGVVISYTAMTRCKRMIYNVQSGGTPRFPIGDERFTWFGFIYSAARDTVREVRGISQRADGLPLQWHIVG